MAEYIEIGRSYKHGNLSGEEGEPIVMEFNPLVFYGLNRQLMQHNPETKEEKRVEVPSV